MMLAGNSGTNLLATPSIPAAHRLGGNWEQGQSSRVLPPNPRNVADGGVCAYGGQERNLLSAHLTQMPRVERDKPVPPSGRVAPAKMNLEIQNIFSMYFHILMVKFDDLKDSIKAKTKKDTTPLECCGSRLLEGRSVCLCWAPSEPKGPKGGSPFRDSLRAICTVLLDPRDPLLHSERTQGFAADPDYWKGEVFAYVGRNQNLKDCRLPSGDPRDLKTALFCISLLRKGEVLAYVGSIQNLKDIKGLSGASVKKGPKGPQVRVASTLT